MSKKRFYELAFPARTPNDNAWIVTEVLNSHVLGMRAAKTLLSDRVANGEAFPSEFIRCAKNPIQAMA